MSASLHKPVLLKETIDLLDVKPGRWYLDATIGGAGHAMEIIKRDGRVFGIDQDKEALIKAKERLKACPAASWKLEKGNFADMIELVEKSGVDSIEGVIFDFGVSSYQLSQSGRGFSFQTDEELDMRMDPENQGVKAKDLLAVLGKKEFYEIFKKYSQEQLAGPIARCIVQSRRLRPITTTAQLRQLAADVYRRFGLRKTRIDPATKIFQALRIVVNDEINNLEKGLSQAFKILKSGGRIAAISFHSGEGRVVKHKFRQWKEKGKVVVLTKSPIIPLQKEIDENPRSRSAKLRGVEKK